MAAADPVSWAAVAAAVSHYAARGWAPVDVPWIVPREVTAITCAERARIMAVEGRGDLVGSAEQSFLALDLAGDLGRGRFLAVSPCFREEPVVDRLHRRTFVKVELYANDDTGPDALERAVGDAEAFFRSLLPRPGLLAREPTAEGLDLTVGGVEVGSYGVRSRGTLAWVYATGLAEPRFSTALRDALP